MSEQKLSGQNVRITKNGIDMTVSGNGRGDVIPHAHDDESTIHFHVDGIAANVNYILIDISDIINYPHLNTKYIHIDNIFIEVDAAAAANYKIKLGFLENVDASNGDRFTVFHLSGSQQTGKDKEIFLPLLPAGIRMKGESLATHDVSLNDTDYQTDTNMKTTLDPGTADTPPGNRDIVCEVIISAGSINLAINIAYHSHPE